MKVTLKRSMIYCGKLYRSGDVIEVDKVDASRDIFSADDVPDVIDEPSEPASLPPLKKKS